MSRVVIEVDECSKNIRSFESIRPFVLSGTSVRLNANVSMFLIQAFGGTKAWIQCPFFIKNDKHACKSREMCKFADLKTERNQMCMKIQIINQSKHPLPQYATPLSAGMDLRANLDEPVILKPLQRCLVPTGLYIALPAGYEAQVRPRSGLAFKKGVTVLNSPGTIDADYRGEIRVILVNLSSEEFVIEDGERIAQMVIARHGQAEWEVVDVLDETERGAGGFGHTGTV